MSLTATGHAESEDPSPASKQKLIDLDKKIIAVNNQLARAMRKRDALLALKKRTHDQTKQNLGIPYTRSQSTQ